MLAPQRTRHHQKIAPNLNYPICLTGGLTKNPRRRTWTPCALTLSIIYRSAAAGASMGGLQGYASRVCLSLSYFHCSLGQSEVRSYDKNADRSIVHNADDPTHWACQLSGWQFCCMIYLAFVSLFISHMVKRNMATNLSQICPVQGRTRLSTILGFINWFR